MDDRTAPSARESGRTDGSESRVEQATKGTIGTGVSRRQFVGLAGGTLAALAGCSESEGSVPVSGAELKHSSSVLGHAFPFVTEDVDLNPWGHNYAGDFPSLLFEYPLTTRPDGSWSTTDLVADLAVEPTTVTVEYSDAYTWWNGEPVTARDRYVDVRINNRIGVRTGIDRVELLDTHTLRYHFPSPIRRSLAVRRALGYVHNTPAWHYESWLERLEDATTQEQLESERAALRADSVSLSAAAENGIGCGPYELTEVSPNRLILDRYEDHPRADAIDIPRLWFPIAKDSRADAMTERGVLDLGQGLLRWINRSPDAFGAVEQLAEHPTRFGVDLLCNFGADHVGRRNVRRAIVSVLPLATIARTGSFGEPVDLQTGLARPVRDRWLSAAFQDRLYRYPVERDDEQAAEFMRRAGYERPENHWLDADGNRAELYIEMPLWGRWGNVAGTIETVLETFGFVVEMRRYPKPSFIGKAGTGRFGLSTWRTTGTPLAAYDVTSTRLGGLGSGVTDAERTNDDRGRPMTPTVPAAPGRLAVDGDGRRIDLLDRYRELRRPASEDRTRELIELFARWWNYTLPNVQLATMRTGIWGNTRDFQWPDPDDDSYRTAGPEDRIDYHLLRRGAVSPAE